jgi:hypothetical protein
MFEAACIRKIDAWPVFESNTAQGNNHRLDQVYLWDYVRMVQTSRIHMSQGIIHLVFPLAGFARHGWMGTDPRLSSCLNSGHVERQISQGTLCFQNCVNANSQPVNPVSRGAYVHAGHLRRDEEHGTDKRKHKLGKAPLMVVHVRVQGPLAQAFCYLIEAYKLETVKDLKRGHGFKI